MFSSVFTFMDIKHYLRDKEDRLTKGFRRIQDLRVFDFNYLPSQPLFRKELKPAIDALLRYDRTHIANHMLIVGSRGSGKTVSLRYLAKLFEERGLHVLYGNCRIHNTSTRLLAHFQGIPPRGLSFSELAERFESKYSGKLVVILDEVDLLSEKDKTKEILYYLSRTSAGYMAVLLSNNPRWATSMDESIQSTLQPESVFFRPYTSEELVAILEERAKLGLRRTESGVLREIAALTAKYTNSDVRVAIKTLYYWAIEPSTKLNDHFQKARRDVVVEVVKNLNDKVLLILKAGAEGEQPVKLVYERYRRLCAEHREEPFSYVYFYSNLAYLQSLGLILLITTKVHRTYTKLFQLTFPSEILDSLWAYRFG